MLSAGPVLDGEHGGHQVLAELAAKPDRARAGAACPVEYDVVFGATTHDSGYLVTRRRDDLDQPELGVVPAALQRAAVSQSQQVLKPRAATVGDPACGRRRVVVGGPCQSWKSRSMD
jgi:hypothetical protein